jgi:hypothetical protein
MVFYCIFLLFVPLVIMDTAKIELQLRYIILVLIALVLIFVASFRSGLPDYDAYIMIFDNSRKGNIGASYDIGYTILNIAVGKIFDSSLPLFILVALLAVLINIRCYKNYFRYAFLAILFYYVHSYLLKELIQIRAGLACAVCLYNVRNIQANKKIDFIFFQLVASSIHMAALVFFIVPIINVLDIRIRTWYIIIFISFMIGTVFPLGRLVKALPGVEYLSRIQVYAGWDKYARSLGILKNITTMKQLVVSILMLYFAPVLSKKIKNFHVMLSAYIFSSCWLMLWNDFAILAARVATFLSIGEPIFISALLYLFPKYFRPVVTILLICITLLILYLNIRKDLGQYKLIFLKML